MLLFDGKQGKKQLTSHQSSPFMVRLLDLKACPNLET